MVTTTEAAALIERHDRVAVISLNRPERLNAWSADLGSALMERLAEAAEDETVGGVVLTGVGRGFSANVTAGLDSGFLESTCVSCGACADSCPTDAITENTLLSLTENLLPR